MNERPIVGPITGSIESLRLFAEASGAKRIDEVRAFLDELFRLGSALGYDAFTMAVQSAVETANWTSSLWEQALNPAGLAITYTGQKSKVFANGRDAARAFVVHTSAYVGNTPPLLLPYVGLDPHYAEVRAEGYWGVAKNFSDYATRWAADPRYWTAIQDRLTAILKYETRPAPMAALNLPYPLIQTIVPAWQSNQRPGIKMTPKWINVHETANRSYGADATMHSNWLLGGAAGGADSQVSVHFFVDDKRAYQMLPLDEVSWNAGCGACEGNYNGISIELCVNADGDYDKAFHNVVLLVAELQRVLGIDEAHTVLHQYWSGKWCPAILLERGLWGKFKADVATARKGATPAPAAYAQHMPVTVGGKAWDGKSTVSVNGTMFYGEITPNIEVVFDGLSSRQWASLDSPLVNGPLKKGQTFNAIGWVYGERVNNEARWWITSRGTRIHVGGTKQKPKILPTIAEKRPKENPYDHGFFALRPDGGPVRFRAVRDTKRLRYAKRQSEEMDTPFKKGNTFTALFATKGENVNGNDRWLVTVRDGRVWSGDVEEIKTTK